MYLISYVVLFCYGGGGGGNHNNNDDKGHKRITYNYCNDARCTKVNQCCKFEMKTKLKLAYEEVLHAVSNQGLTLTQCKDILVLVRQSMSDIIEAINNDTPQKNLMIKRKYLHLHFIVFIWHEKIIHFFAGIRHFSIHNYPCVYTPFRPVDMHTLSNCSCHTPLFLMFFYT